MKGESNYSVGSRLLSVTVLRGALETASRERKVLILSDSQAAIAAVKRLVEEGWQSETGLARTRDLVKVMRQVKERTDRLGPGAVRFAWVKAHNGLAGNERADELAKRGANEEPDQPVVTEGGLRQEWKKMRERERRVKGCGMGRVIGWKGRKAIVNYTRCRTGKGNLLRWQKILDPDLEDGRCRECGLAEETGAHIALVCRELQRTEILGIREKVWELGTSR